MLYSSYRNFLITFWLVITVVFALGIATVSPGLAVLFAVFLVIVGGIGVFVELALVRARIDDHGGRFPMPGWLGLLGVDITDTPEDSSRLTGYDDNLPKD